ncbi:MAG: asparagine synthase (glutamine-hydrolyzing) [Rhodospirillales bacterium CG15_BIG_FIL_POST_REV_8_21_14_020_66_15]|nr:MAG: asparagine synthase (glutamine-hydrolyzing) [Rhodospirillales bacterium CG15_BIG_FIL_POST_REV_8_21_14_020_66_15]
MCGIAGTLGPATPDAGRIKKALSALARRGPDASGHRVLDLGGHRAALLHTRLSIIDLDARADQPFERDGLVVTYNGEIYNYLELKAELEALGHAFATTSDTEVLVAAWREWGPAALDRLEGMWAFAIADTKAGTLTLCRDRFGEKPLYLWPRGGTLHFASEIKALAALAGETPPVNRTQVLRYLTLGYKSLYKSGDTFFDGVFELPPSTYLTLSSPDLKQPEFYWQLKHIPRPMSAEEALEGARERLFRSVELRLRADVPVAFCLSGGIDSSTLAAIAARKLGADIHCFSVIDADERYNESANIKAMVEALGCAHHVTHTSTEGFFERMADLVAYHDAPVATISYYVHSFLSEAIHDAGYKVAVSGTGADELYTGYYDHYSMWLAQMWKRAQIDPAVDFETLLSDWKGGFGAHVQNPLLRDPMTFVREPGQRGHITLDQDVFEGLLARPFHEDFEETAFTGELLRNRMMNELFAESIPVILHEDDCNSMRWSVENRSPYLDRPLAEFLYSVPSEYLIGGGFAKLLLRQAGDGLVPDSVRLDKRKRGFNASINSLVDRGDGDTRDRLLAPGPIFDLIDRSRFEAFLKDDMASNSFSKFLFSFISARIFLDQQAVESQ